MPLSPEIERAALIGYPIAHRLFRHQPPRQYPVRARRPRTGHGRRLAAGRHGRSAESRTDPGQPPLRSPTGARGRAEHAQLRVPGPRRGGPARGRGRDRERDGHLGDRAPLGDRPAPRPRRPRGPHRDPVPRRVGPAVAVRRPARDQPWALPRPPAMRSSRAGSWSSRCSRSSAGSGSRFCWESSPASTRRYGPRGSRPRRPCGACEAQRASSGAAPVFGRSASFPVTSSLRKPRPIALSASREPNSTTASMLSRPCLVQ